MKNVFVLSLSIFWSSVLYGQTCTSNPTTISSSTNFSSVSWTSTGGASCPPSGNFTGDVVIIIGNNVNLTMDSDLTINGDFLITNNGSSTLTIPSGVDIHVTGDMGDANNNSVSYVVDGTLRVDGTFYGKNGNSFSGSGSISGGNLDLGNGSSCGNPCPVTGGFTGCTAGDSFCSTNSVLPVILLDFSAQATKESIRLNWATIREENFREFVLQRSGKGIDFEDVASIPGAGKNIYEIRSDYSFEDKAPLIGWNYYRLKAVDLDDSYEYFEVIAAKYSGGKELTVFPNPSAGESISFRTNFNASEHDRVIVTNHLGVEIANVHVTSVSDNNISFASKLFPGVYVLKYVSENFERTVKVVVKN